MSATALKEYEHARNLQLTRNDARRIRTRVEASQQNPVASSRRWPFELMQNAHDAGPRAADERIDVLFRLQDRNLIVSHTGKPFTAQELAALLSGGSSKEFDDLETTGRFGTGFLATHTLSTRVTVDGVLVTEDGHEHFIVELDRSGDEESITENIEQANTAVNLAKPIADASLYRQPTASFTYQDVDHSAANTGLEHLKVALPYLYGTCPNLGRVTIELQDASVQFACQSTTTIRKSGFAVERATIEIVTPATNHSRQVSIVRIGEPGAVSALLALFEDVDGTVMQFVPPIERFPRLFVQFPLAQTSALPLSIIIDGRFTPQQERDGIAVNSDDRALISDALKALPVLVGYAVESGWENAHQLAHIAAPERPLGGENATDEIGWWRECLLKVAGAMAEQPIIHTAAGFLPAIAEGGSCASFVVPAIDKDSEGVVDYARVHEIASEITEFHIPSMSISQDWDQIATEWENLGVPVGRFGFRELTDWTKDRAETAETIPLDNDPYQWLAKLFLLGADMDDLNADAMVNRLLPNQHGRFCDTEKLYLYWDAGVPKRMKDIGGMVSIDLKSKLLHDYMAKSLSSPGFESAKRLVRRLLDTQGDGDDYGESYALREIVGKLETVLPKDHLLDGDSDLSALRASACLVQYLWESQASDYKQDLRKCPLLTAAGKIAHLAVSEQILSPVVRWPASARPYAKLYTERRLLSDRYCEDDVLCNALDPLIAAGVVVKAPVYRAERSEIDDVNLLRAMSSAPSDMVGVAVRNEPFGQIAFLSTDLVQRCGQDAELAALLLDFVLSVAAKEDQSWREVNEVMALRAGEPVALPLRGATWPFELKVRSWVPVRIPDEDSFQPMPANESNLREILDTAWLRDNRDGVDLLHEVFGFRQLTLLIDSLGSNMEVELIALGQRSI